MKENNLFRIIWIVGIYAILVLILYLIIVYKVKWEYKNEGPSLYFYNCGDTVCTTTTKVDNYYSKVSYEKGKAPYIKNIHGDIAILSSDNKDFIYNYITGITINEKYDTYKLSSDYNYIVKNKDIYSIIDINGNEIVSSINESVTDYKAGYILYQENNKYGIINPTKNIEIAPSYEDIILINEYLYAYLEEGSYFIASYDTELPIVNDKYDYLISINNCIVTFKNKQINIISESLQQKLLMKIDSYYTYRVEEERDTLNMYDGGNYIKFKVYQNKDNYIEYIYDIKNSKLIN